MPANGTNGQGVGMTDEEIWQIISYLRSIQAGASAKKLGNTTHGNNFLWRRQLLDMPHGGREGRPRRT